MKITLFGKITSINLLPLNQALYEAGRLEKPPTPFFFFTFRADRGAFELDDKVTITVENNHDGI